MTTWTDVTPQTTSWGVQQSADGYTVAGYVQAGYILGTNQWANASSVSSAWTNAASVSSAWTDAASVSTTWTAA